jgi:cytochrome P450
MLLEEKTIVGVNPWVEHYNPTVFDRPYEFRPERWLTSDADKLAEMNRHWIPVRLLPMLSHCLPHMILPSNRRPPFRVRQCWLTPFQRKQFGLGSRTCIGRHISMLEMCKLVPRIVRDFDLELAGGLEQRGRKWRTRNWWFVKPEGLVVRVRERKRVG